MRAGWLAHLEPEALDGLQTLNRSLWAWIEGDYHNTPHRGLEGRTPLEQWALASAGVRYPEPTLNLDEIFLFEVRRRVQKDRTVSLDGRLYEVEPLLVGRSVSGQSTSLAFCLRILLLNRPAPTREILPIHSL